jgi:NAD(P)-dependent dehydrogenase (short-subunit alcohol dehydrogenase family)
MPTENDATSKNKIAIVTGGSRGIGRNIVLSLAKRGVNSIFTYNSNQTEAEKVVGLAAETEQKAIALQLDTGNVGAFDKFVQSVESTLKSLGVTHFDYLVNNAGNNHRNMAFEKATEEELDSVYNVHFKGVFFLSQKLLPLIRDGGRIVKRIDSANAPLLAWRRGVWLDEGAIEVLTKYMAKELGPRRIAVNVVAPGAVETDFSGGVVRDNPVVNKRVADGTALGRAGVPDDIGPMIASLLSEENRWINAERIEVSGGYV